MVGTSSTSFWYLPADWNLLQKKMGKMLHTYLSIIGTGEESEECRIDK